MTELDAVLETLVAVDPGASTGISIGTFSRTKPWTPLRSLQIVGGVRGFIDWFKAEDDLMGARWVSEKFVLSAGNEFVADLSPVRIEGAMLALGLAPAWQGRAQKSQIPDLTLRRLGFWLTGKQIGMPDASDANDATRHALIYMRKIGHLPTIEQYWGENAATYTDLR